MPPAGVADSKKFALSPPFPVVLDRRASGGNVWPKDSPRKGIPYGKAFTVAMFGAEIHSPPAPTTPLRVATFGARVRPFHPELVEG